MIHDHFAIDHLKENSFHLQILEFLMNKLVNDPHIPGRPEDPQLRVFVHLIHIIIQQVFVIVKVNSVELPVVWQVFFLVAHKFANEILGNGNDDDLEGLMDGWLMVRGDGLMVIGVFSTQDVTFEEEVGQPLE